MKLVKVFFVLFATVFAMLFIACSTKTETRTQKTELELYGAGSLREVMTEMAMQYEKITGITVNTTFGYSGAMREKAEQPGTADIFTSANMGHPHKLQDDGRSLFTAEFAQNVLCIFSNDKSGINDQNVLETLLNPSIKLGIFPPEDPAGEYSLLMFKRAEAIQPGAEKALTGKTLVINPDMVKGNVPEGETFVTQLMREGTIDMFIAYASGESEERSLKDTPVLRVAKLPPALQVGANYGLTVLNDAKPEAYQLALFILSEQGQGLLKQFGFSPIGLTR